MKKVWLDNSRKPTTFITSVICKVCGLTKNTTEAQTHFSERKDKKEGTKSRWYRTCVACARLRAKKIREERSFELSSKKREYAIKNADHIKAYKSRYYFEKVKGTTRARNLYLKHKEKRLAANRAKKLSTTKDLEALLHRRWVRSLSERERFIYDLWKRFSFTSSKNGREFTISYEDLLKVADIQKDKCKYTGLNLQYKSNYHETASLDRIDSSKGYTIDNICLCCCIINLMKLDLTLAEFHHFCKEVSENAKIIGN